MSIATTQLCTSSCDRDHIAWEALNIYYLTVYRKRFANPQTRVLNDTKTLVSFLRCEDYAVAMTDVLSSRHAGSKSRSEVL